MEFHQTWLEEAINWCNNSSITSWNFIRLGGKVKYDVAINWLDFEWDYIAGGDQIWNVLSYYEFYKNA